MAAWRSLALPLLVVAALSAPQSSAFVAAPLPHALRPPSNQGHQRSADAPAPLCGRALDRGVGRARVACLGAAGDAEGSGNVVEGSLTTRGCKIWYQVARPPESQRGLFETREMRSKRAALPLVVLHGGPGIPHDYLLPLAGLAESAGGRAVFFYDQLGSGNSDSPQDEEFYSVEQCAQDVVTTLEHFAANEDLVARGGFHLYGHSWGGCLAAETLLRHAGESSLLKSKLASVTLASTPTGPDAAMNAARELIEKYKAELSAKPMEERNMRADWPREPEYIEQWLLQEANRMFQEEHNMRGVVKDPECLNQAMSKAGEVWRGAWVAGGWAVDAAELERGWPKGLRATVLRGEHDFLTKADVAPYLEGIKGAEYVELPGLSHMAHLEDSPLYLETLEACLRRGDAEWAARS